MCRAEAPHLSALQEEHRGSGLVVLGINCDNDTPERIRGFVEAKRLAYRMLVRGDGVATRQYHCRAYPTLYWIDREGRIAARDYGFQPPAKLAERAKDLLRGPSER